MKNGSTLLLCVLLFALALVVTVLFEGGPSQDTDTAAGSGVVISEIMSYNRTYPDKQGKVLDYIEICNLSGKSVDISNYKLSDDETTIGYTFPVGTILPAYGYAVCWCDAQGGDAYASFGISKDGGETIYLYNSANVLIDQQTVPAMEENNAYVRAEDGSFSVSQTGSPGYANTAEGNAQWLSSMGYTAPELVISEVQTAAVHTWLDPEGTVCDWIELYNAGSTSVVLDGAYLSDDPADPLKWCIPSLTLKPGAYGLIRCGGGGPDDADFSLPRSGCTLTLSGPLGNPVYVLECPGLNRDASWALQTDGTYLAVTQPTPGYENTASGYEQWLTALGIPDCQVVISEVQTANRSAVLDSRGQLCDWVELYNAGTTTAVLDGTFLSDDPDEPMKWQIPSLTLEPGQRAVIPCAGTGAGAGEADFALPRSGCTVLLAGPVGNVIYQTECPALEEDRSWQLLEDGTYIASEQISPGYENSEDGYRAYRQSQNILGALAVWEVMPANNRYMIQRDGEYYDWVELKNVSSESIDLSDYAISDNSGDLLLCRLPQRTLAPGETVVVICSGNTELSGTYIHAPFTLNRQECWVYVTHVASGLSDYVRISGVPQQGSAGRMDGENGIFYFSTPTPGQENTGGLAQVTQDPFVETPDGVYNDVASVSVVLSGEGQIHYTLDGRVPTENSPVYTGPLTLTGTTVVRARSFCDNKLPSATVTASYIINEDHTLPVISVSADPDSMFGAYGIYTKYFQDWEIPCNLTLFEDGEGFSIDCGIKMYGHTGLTLDKKSFKVNFRGCYGESVLNYPVYGEDGPIVYDSLCIRSGQDYPQSIFRDELFTSLCRDMSDTVLAQRDKFCILYINGEYFGIYCLKEAFSEMFYAQNREVRKESVEIVQAPVEYDTEMHEFFRFLDSHDMSDPENYEYACTVFNMDSVIDWMIIEGYSTNGDVQQNLRYFRSTDNGNRFEMAFYDLDWAFYYHLPFTDVLSSQRSYWQHLMLTQNLMDNPTFRQKFLERLSYHMENTLSNENVLARIDYYHDLLAPEVTRERARWGGTYSAWEWQVNRLRSFITDTDYLGQIVDYLRGYIGLTQQEVNTYFSKWD